MSSSKPGSSPDALALTIRYTRARVRSAHEVLEYLDRRGIPPRIAVRAVESAKALGVVDDRACARLWAGHWARRGYAASAIQARLSVKGLEGRAVEQALRGLEAEGGDAARVRQAAAAQRRRGVRSPKRLARALASRGFDEEMIAQVVDAEP